jgi:hypothetical protein
MTTGSDERARGDTSNVPAESRGESIDRRPTFRCVDPGPITIALEAGQAGQTGASIVGAAGGRRGELARMGTCR